MSDQMPVAWVVEGDGRMVIAYAMTKKAAACIASEELEVPMDDVVAKRATALDEFGPGPIEHRQLLQNIGWAVPCHVCEEIINPSNKKEMKRACYSGHVAFCSRECAGHYLTLCKELEPQLKEARRHILKLCPDAKLIRWWLGGDEGQIVYQFRAPGSLHLVTWREGTPHVMYAVESDLEQIKEYTEKSRRLH